MRKMTAIFAFFSTIFALVLFLPTPSKVEAATVDTRKVLEVLSSEEATLAIREIVKVGTEIKQGNTSTLKKTVFKRALEEAGIYGQVNELIIEEIKDIDFGTTSGITDAAAKVAGNVVKEKVKARLSERLAPHQDAVLVLATILNEYSHKPKATQ